MHLRGRIPIVRRAGIVLVRAANERAVFHARDIVDVATSVKGAGMLDRVERNQGAVSNHLGAQAIDLSLRTVAPVDMLGPGEGGNLMNPGPKRRVGHPNARRAAALRNASTARHSRDGIVE